MTLLFLSIIYISNCCFFYFNVVIIDYVTFISCTHDIAGVRYGYYVWLGIGIEIGLCCLLVYMITVL